jgi:hypothetical protein
MVQPRGLYPGHGAKSSDKPGSFLQPFSANEGLARLEWSCAGKLGNEAGGALGAGGGQRSEDLPGTRTLSGFVTTGDFACDHRWAQLAFGQVVGGVNAIVIQEGKKMVALFIEATAHGFFAGLAAGSLQ